MTSYQEDRFGTLLKVDLFISSHVAALIINPLFAAADAELDTLRADILANDVLAERDLSGFTEAKAEKRIELETKLFLVCNGLRGHFAGLGDKTSLRQVDLEKSHIETISEELLNTESELVWKIADPIKALLAANQVTATDADNLQTTRQDFVGMMKVNRKEEGSSKAARENLVTLFEKAFNKVLAKLDDLMMPFASTTPTVYSEYQTARMIDDSGGGSGSEGYELQNYTIPAGGLVVIADSPLPGNNPNVYLRNLSGTNAIICTTDGTTGPCATGYNILGNTLYKALWSGLGLNPNLPKIQISNPGTADVLIRAGTKKP